VGNINITVVNSLRGGRGKGGPRPCRGFTHKESTLKKSLPSLDGIVILGPRKKIFFDKKEPRIVRETRALGGVGKEKRTLAGGGLLGSSARV